MSRRRLSIAFLLALIGASSWCVHRAWDWIWYVEIPYSWPGYDLATSYTLMRHGVAFTSGPRTESVFGLYIAGRFGGFRSGAATLWYPETGFKAQQTQKIGAEYVTTFWGPSGDARVALRRKLNTPRTSLFLGRLAVDLTDDSPLWLGDQTAPSAPWIARGQSAKEWWDDVKDRVREYDFADFAARYSKSRWAAMPPGPQPASSRPLKEWK